MKTKPLSKEAGGVEKSDTGVVDESLQARRNAPAGAWHERLHGPRENRWFDSGLFTPSPRILGGGQEPPLLHHCYASTL